MRRKSVLSLVALVTAVALVASSAAAQTATPPPYYESNASSVDLSAWLSGLVDASFGDALSMLVRIGPYVIGGGVSAQGGVGSAGVLLTGALLGAVVMGTGIRARVGPVGGIVFAVATTFAFFSIGVGPGWLYAVVLFGVGLIASVALIRALR